MFILTLLLILQVHEILGIHYTCSKTRLTKNVLTLTPALTLILTLTLTLTQTLTLKHNNIFGLTK